MSLHVPACDITLISSLVSVLVSVREVAHQDINMTGRNVTDKMKFMLIRVGHKLSNT